MGSQFPKNPTPSNPGHTTAVVAAAGAGQHCGDAEQGKRDHSERQGECVGSRCAAKSTVARSTAAETNSSQTTSSGRARWRPPAAHGPRPWRRRRRECSARRCPRRRSGHADCHGSSGGTESRYAGWDMSTPAPQSRKAAAVMISNVSIGRSSGSRRDRATTTALPGDPLRRCPSYAAAAPGFASDDAAEGMRAFSERRLPQWASTDERDV